MKLAKYALVPALLSDNGNAETAAESAQIQINNVSSVTADNQTLQGKAYDTVRSYLTEVRVPVLQTHLCFYSQYSQDIKSDLAALAWLPWGFGDIIDTIIIGLEIAALGAATTAALVFAYSPAGLLIPGSIESYQKIKQFNDEAIQKLIDARDRAEQYANNSTIYAGSVELAAQLDKASKTLSEVSFDPTTGTYDLSGITDSSWKISIAEDYWEHYNYVILSHYFYLDQNGNPIFIKPEMIEEIEDILNKTMPYAINANGEIDLSRVGDFADALSYDEKYFLLFVVSTYGDEVFALESAAMKGQDLEDLKKGVFALVSLFGDERNNPLSNYLSFIKNGDVITSIDSSNSFQANGGFSDIFDLATKFLGMDIDTHITTFIYDDKEYRLQVWDGQYGAGTHIGGEIGLYSRPESEAIANPYIPKDPEEYVKDIRSLTPAEVNNMYINYESVKGDEQIPMILHVYDKDGNPVLENDTKKYIDDGTHYWDFAIVGNDPKNPLDKNDLNVIGELTFEDPGMRAAAKAALIEDGHKVAENGDVLTVAWE